ncbi:hypothetical protein FH972_023224 [Carpinus fangiana]|uniref:Uncharacterized protein n=1 Tax=Carpinus fangiana TaxID=176857 RepID=A0A5N6KV71_9ROSI|nr:hypothetical protein FH972_023224 [Carpinus fangiana]
METKESMSLRADSFLDTHLVPLLTNTSPEAPLVVAVVSHGMLLSSLWRAILKRQQRSSVTLAADVLRDHGNVSIEHLGGWSNTAYLELLFHPRSPVVDPSEALRPKSNGDCAPVTSAGQSTAPNYLDTVSNAAVTAPGELRTGKATATGNEPNTRTGACSTSPTDGLLDIEGVAMSAKPPSFQITILAVNSTVHLKGLKRTRGGVGSAQHDEKQRSLHSFFGKKQKTG